MFFDNCQLSKASEKRRMAAVCGADECGEAVPRQPLDAT